MPGGDFKFCKQCGLRFERGTTSRFNWQFRKFCTSDCREAHHDKTNRKMPKGIPEPRAEEVASRELLKRLVRAGLKQGYLYSMPANDVRKLADELGIAA